MVTMEIKIDSQGFLLNANDWTEEWASETANSLGLAWEPKDIEITQALRNFYFEYDLSPAMRPLVKHIKNQFGADTGNSIWLMQRYGESPARVLALLSGLPKPKNCL